MSQADDGFLESVRRFFQGLRSTPSDGISAPTRAQIHQLDAEDAPSPTFSTPPASPPPAQPSMTMEQFEDSIRQHREQTSSPTLRTAPAQPRRASFGDEFDEPVIDPGDFMERVR